MVASKEDSHGGYVVDVINEADKKKFACMLCLSIIKKATHGCAKHVFCFDCLQEYIKSNESKTIQKCPAGCQKTFNISQLSLNDPYDQLINQIDCECSSCGWKGELLCFINVHDKICQEKIIPCQLCNIVLKRKYMHHHSKDVCSHRPMTCRGCKNDFPFVNDLKHEESCGDVKVKCSFTSFGCNKEIRRRKMIAHESNKCQQHLTLMANYVTGENKLLKGENKQLKEETKQLKKETKQLKEESIQVKEENKQIKEKVESLETNIKILTWKINIPPILLKEPANMFFHFPVIEEMHIKNIAFVPSKDLFDCFSKNNFTLIIEHLASKCDVLNNYKQELHELFSSAKTIIFNFSNKRDFYFFPIDYFNDYKCGFFSLKRDGNIFHIENRGNFHLTFYILKWFIKINSGMMKIDITNPDDRFRLDSPPYLSSKYFSLLLSL